MVKFRFMLIAILLVSASANMSAAWRIVFDRNCLKIVMANTASQKVIEEQHNQRVDTIAAKKQKVELYTVSMATMKELYKLSMENISGFGTESLYYKEIGLCALDNSAKCSGTCQHGKQGQIFKQASLSERARQPCSGNTAAGRQLRQYREQCQDSQSVARTGHCRKKG